MHRFVMLALGFSLAVVASGWAAEVNPEQAKAIAEIEKLGGRVTLDEKSPSKPVIGVNLTCSLKVTDAGLVHLKGLTTLRSLNLGNTKATDAGLEHLRGLADLHKLILWDTWVTDAGLEHLNGLTNLQSLDLRKTQVTENGVKKLQQALPGCQITWDGAARKEEPNMHEQFFVGWGILSLINAGLAQSKCRSGLLWWFISLFLGPIATFVIVVLPKVPEPPK